MEYHHVEGMTPAVVAMLKKVAEESAKRTMVDSFLMIGIDITDPIKAQDAFAALRKLAASVDDPEKKADDYWVRTSRRRSEGTVGKLITALIGIGVLNFFYLVGVGIKTALSQLPPQPPPH